MTCTDNIPSIVECKSTTPTLNFVEEQKYTDDQKSDYKHKVNVSKIRCFASQFVAVLVSNIAKFTHGNLYGYVTVLIAELYKKDAEITMSLSELTWFSSGCFMAPVGALIVGLLSQNIGSRKSIMVATILHTISWTLFYFAMNSAMLLVAGAITGFVYSVSFVPGCTYIAEICQPHLRATFLASNNMFILIGSFYSVLLGTMLHWKTIALANLSIPVVGFVAMCFIPDSPQWLASKGRMTQAKSAMAWLRGWTLPQNVQHEFNILKAAYQNPEKKIPTSDVNRENNKNSRQFSTLKDTFKPYIQRSFYLPLVCVCYMFILHVFTGSAALMMYVIVIFEMINSPIEKFIAAAIFDGLKVFASISCVLFIGYIGKRRIVLTSMTGTIISYTTISIVVFLISHNYISPVYSWIPTIAMMFATFLTSGGIDKVVYMLNVEIFPTQFRSTGAGVGLLLSTFFGAVLNKIFLYMVEDITLPGVYLFFVFVNIIAITSYYFMVPETNGRTLKEIEDHFSGVKKLESKSKSNII